MSAPREPDLRALAWPAGRADAALAALAGRDAPEAAAAAAHDRATLERRLPAGAARAGFEARELQPAYRELDDALRRAGPALVVLPGEPPGVLAVRGARGRALRVLVPGGGERRVAREAVRVALCAEWEAPLGPGIGALVAGLGLDAARRAAVARALLAEQLHTVRIGGLWALRPSPAGAPLALARAHGLPGRLALLLGAHLAQYALWLVAWSIVGRGALAGDLAPRALLAWGALLLALLPLRLLVSWTEGRLSLAAGALLKERLMHGATRLDPEEVRHLGAGAHLGRVIEAEAVELLGLGGGLQSLLAVIELAAAAWVLARGAAAPLTLALLAAWLVALALAAGRVRAARRRWTDERLAATAELVEAMAGHETRLAQLPPEQWHDGEDERLAAYHERSRAFDRAEASWGVASGRGWLLLGVAGLAGAFVAGAAPTALAVALGGVLIAYQAFARLAGGLGQLFGADLSWARVRPLFDAAARPESLGAPETFGAAPASADAPPLACEAVTFRHPGARADVLRGCALVVGRGERLRLEGPSGGGKSTLVSLLSGLRVPRAGVVRAGGDTLETLGRDGWRERVAVAPQHHENHVFTASLAFNLLMGRRWPPRPEDVVEAERVCRSLGLDGLLERMPGGVHQAVGETGWQLSHGERDRVFLARALLQGGALLVLDESLGALDPETLRVGVERVMALDAAVLLVGHLA